MFQDSSNPQDSSSAPAPKTANSKRESAQILVIGSKTAITSIVHALCALRFCHISEWSPFLPAPTPGKLMRSLLRKVSAD